MSGEGTIADVLAGRARWCVVEGDALATLTELPDGCVDAVVTDPPYASTTPASPRCARCGAGCYGLKLRERDPDVHSVSAW